MLAVYAWLHPAAAETVGRLYDDEVYLSLGRAIAEGDGYRSVHLVGAPVHVKFPPLLPFVYAGLWQLFGTFERVAAVALAINVAIVAAAAGLVWYLARRELNVGAALAAVFVVAPMLTRQTMFYFSGAASEPWMLLGWAGALALVAHIERGDGARSTTRVALALGLVLAATALARTQAVVIVPAILVALLLRRVSWRAVAVAAVAAAVPLVVWNRWHAAMLGRGPVSPLPDQSGYAAWIPTGSVGEFIDFAALASYVTAPHYLREMAGVLAGYASTKTVLLAAAWLVLGAVGLVLLARRFPALVLSTLTTIAVILVWPYVQDRFLTPLLPVLGLAGAAAAQRFIDWFPARLRVAAFGGAALVAAVLVWLGVSARYAAIAVEPRSPYVVAMGQMSDWIRRNTRPDERIMTARGGTIFLRTGRRTSISDPEEPLFGASVFDQGRRFLAGRLLADSVDVIAIWDRAPGRSEAWLRGLGARCPGLLTLTDTTRAPSAGGIRSESGDLSRVRYFRVRRDVPCLAAVAAGSRTEAAPRNKNAP